MTVPRDVLPTVYYRIFELLQTQEEEFRYGKLRGCGRTCKLVNKQLECAYIMSYTGGHVLGPLCAG